MNDKKLVSIVLTTLNGEKFISESIDSCINQTYRNIELIVVDGGSNDDTISIIEGYSDERIQIVHQQNNEGKLPGALNLGLAQARGAYLTWHQDDCYYDPVAIEKMVQYLDEHDEIDQVYCDWWLIKANGERGLIHVRPPDELAAAKSDPVGVCFLIRREVRENIGIHRIEAFPSQDYDYRLRIALRFKSGRIRQPLYFYREHDNSLTGQLGWELLARKDVETRLYWGVCSQKEGRKDLGDIDIAEAFEHYLSGDSRGVPSLILTGLYRNPRHLSNPGVWSIFLRSVVNRFRVSKIRSSIHNKL